MFCRGPWQKLRMRKSLSDFQLQKTKRKCKPKRRRVFSTDLEKANMLCCPKCSYTTRFPSYLKRHLLTHEEAPGKKPEDDAEETIFGRAERLLNCRSRGLVNLGLYAKKTPSRATNFYEFLGAARSAKTDTIEKAYAKRIVDIPTVSANMDVYKSRLRALQACAPADLVEFERLTAGKQVLISRRDLYDKELDFDASPSAQLRATNRFMYHLRARHAAERRKRGGELRAELGHAVADDAEDILDHLRYFELPQAEKNNPHKRARRRGGGRW